MNKLTKLLSVFIIAGAVGAGVAGVAGCKKDKGHSHSIDSTKWTDNEDGSTHDGFCSCGELMVDDEEHIWDGGACIKCGAVEGAEAVTVTSVTVSAQSGATAVAVEGKLQLRATVAGTGNFPQTVTWTSSDDTKATVSETGEVTGVAEGEVTITATSTRDTSKFGTYTLTVAPKGSVTVIPDYETLVAQSDKLYSNDFSTAAARLPDFSGTYGGTRGVYTDFAVNKDKAGATKDTHYVKVADGKAVQVNPSEGTAYTVVDFGAIKGDIEGYIEVTLSEAANGMTFVQFIGNSTARTGSEVFGLRTDGGAVKYRLDGGSTYVGADPAISTATQMSVYFRYASGKMTVAINGKFLCKDLETTITKLSGFRLASGDSNTRTVNADNLVFCGEEMSAADYKPVALANLDAEYAKYKLTGDGATHTTNGGLVTEAYTDGKTAIGAKNTISEISEAYASAVAAMKDVLSDAQIPVAKQAAKDALAEKFPADNYTYAFAEDSDDSIYNNQTKYGEEIAAIEALIESGASKQSNLDSIVANATISIGNDATQLAAKKTATNTALTAYRADEIAELQADHADVYAEIQAIKTAGVGATAQTFEAVNAAYTAATQLIDQKITSTRETAAQAQIKAEEAIDAAADTAKDGIDNADYTALINGYVTAAKTDIQAQVNSETGTAKNVYKISELAVAKIQAAKTLYTAKTTAEAEIHGASTAASTATSTITTAYNTCVTAIGSAETATAIDSALETAQTAITGAITTLKATKFTVTVKKATGTTAIGTIEFVYGSALEIDESKLTITDSERIDGYYSTNTDGVLSGELTLSEITVYENKTIYVEISEVKRIQVTNEYKFTDIDSTGFSGDNVKLDSNNFVKANAFLTVNDVIYDETTGAITSTPVTWRSGNKVCIENKDGGLSFTVGGASTVTLKFCSTSSENESRIGLQGADGKYIVATSMDSGVSLVNTTEIKPATDKEPEKNCDNRGAYKMTGTTQKEITFKVEEAGTYTIVCPSDYTGRGARIYGIKVVQDYKVDLDVSVVWGSGTAQKYYHDDVISLPEETPAGNGKFIGWYNKTTGDQFEGGKKLAAGSYVFEARYEYNVKVTYKVNEDDEEGIPLYIYAEDRNDLLAQLPTLDPKDGNAHSGWTYADGSAIDFATIEIGTAASPKEYNFKPVYSDPTSIKVTAITVSAPKGEDGEPITKVLTGKTIQLTATVTPDNAYNKAVTWNCPTTGVTVSETGLVTVGKDVAAGNITITATAKDAEEGETPVSGSITLTVEKAPATKTKSLVSSDYAKSTTWADQEIGESGFYAAPKGSVKTAESTPSGGSKQITIKTNGAVTTEKVNGVQTPKNAIVTECNAGTVTVKVKYYSSTADLDVAVFIFDEEARTFTQVAIIADEDKTTADKVIHEATLTFTLSEKQNIYIGSTGSSPEYIRIDVTHSAS